MRALLAWILLTPLCTTAAVEGDLAPDFDLHLLAGSDIVSLSEHAGKVVYLDFWASWCAPCRVSFPDIITLKQNLEGEAFEVIAINLDENIEDAKRFLRRYETSYPILKNPAGTVAAQYKLPGMPTSFIIDKTGVIRYRHAGYQPGDMEQITNRIKLLLEAPAL